VLKLPHIYKLHKIAAAISDFTKFLRWPLVCDKCPSPETKEENTSYCTKSKHQQLVSLPYQSSKNCWFMKALLAFRAGVGTYLLSRASWIVHYRWWAAKSVDFIL